MAQQPTLRVMRLYKPSLYYVASTSPFITPEAQFNFPLSNFLMFPDSFGDLFVGETFKAYIAVINTLNAPKEALVNTTLSIKIQTSSSSHELFDSSKGSMGGAELQEGASLSQVISYAISGAPK